MRRFWILAALASVSALSLAGAGVAADCNCPQPCACGPSGGDPCDPCNGDCRGCGLFGHHRHRRGPRYEGLDPGFNCGCNGSYKFPVPPLYTYHWPGMWQQPLMTDYHSPWRFPPLKPYVDEPPAAVMGIDSGSNSGVRQASAYLPTGQERVSFGRRLEHMTR